MVPVSYTTLQDLKDSYLGNWKDAEWDKWATASIPLASGIVRNTFRKYGLDLDTEILAGRTELMFVQMAVNNMLIRKLAATGNSIAGSSEGLYGNVSASAAGYSISYTPSADAEGLYLKKGEKENMNLPYIAVGTLRRRIFKDEEGRYDEFLSD